MSPRNPEPTRTAILAAAGELLESGGPDAVTLRSVGAQAGVSRSAAYRHFDDKAALLRALATQTLLQMAERIRHEASTAHASDTDAPTTDRNSSALRRGCRAYIAFALEHPHRYQLIFGDAPIAQPTPELESAADEAMASVQQLVETAQRLGTLDPAQPPRELATVVWVLLHGLAQLQLTGHLHEPRTVDGSAWLYELLDLALTSLSADSKA